MVGGCRTCEFERDERRAGLLDHSVGRFGAPFRAIQTVLCLVLTVAFSGCLPDFPTAPTVENPGDPTPRFSDPRVWISDPEDNGIVRRAELFSSAGVAIMFEGEFKPGHELHLLAARVESPDFGFFITVIPITDTLSPGPAFIQSSPTIVGNSDRIRLKLRLRDDQNLLVSIDSVTLRLR